MSRPSLEAPPLRGNVEGVEWPPLLAGPHATLAALLHELEGTQWLSSDELAARQRTQLGRLAEHAALQSPPFLRRLRDAELRPEQLAEPEGLARLPLLSRRTLERGGDALVCREIPQSHLPLSDGRSSGSTGEPVVVKRTAISRLFWMAMTLRDHRWQRRDFTGRLTAIRANIREYEEAPSWGAPVSLLFESGPSQGIPISTPIHEQIALLEKFQPACLIVYPSNLAALTVACEARPLALRLAHIRTIGETLSPELREAAARVFGTCVEDLYSSQEVGNIALECPETGLYHTTAESLIVEVLREDGSPCSDGEIGRVVITDLHNFATPIVRYDIGDFAELAGPCPCGRGLPTLRRILGRERNLVRKPDGTRHWPLVGFSRFRQVAPISQVQLVQESSLMIEVRLVCERPLESAEEERLRRVILASLGFPFALRFSYFEDRLPLGKSGKFEEFVCQIAPSPSEG